MCATYVVAATHSCIFISAAAAVCGEYEETVNISGSKLCINWNTTGKHNFYDAQKLCKKSGSQLVTTKTQAAWDAFQQLRFWRFDVSFLEKNVLTEWNV